MKWATRLWREAADKEHINYKLVNLVHDEWVSEVYDSEDAARRLGELQCQAIKQTGLDLEVYCPLAGSTSVGFNWAEVH